MKKLIPLCLFLTVACSTYTPTHTSETSKPEKNSTLTKQKIKTLAKVVLLLCGGYGFYRIFIKPSKRYHYHQITESKQSPS